MSGFTKGPWSVREGLGVGDELCHHSIHDAEGNYIASTWAEPNEPNANLMAAAPDMYGVLDCIRIEDCDCMDGMENEVDACQQCGGTMLLVTASDPHGIKDALAKARGKSS